MVQSSCNLQDIYKIESSACRQGWEQAPLVPLEFGTFPVPPYDSCAQGKCAARYALSPAVSGNLSGNADIRGLPFIMYAPGGGGVKTPYAIPIFVMSKKSVQGEKSDLA